MEVTNESIQEQANVLREIRDEIRASRTTSPFGGNAATSGRPQNTFVQSQMFMDRVASGEWASMGWANAYRSQLHSSWSNDLMGSMGLLRSPNSMTQMEYQGVSSQSLNNRVGRFLGGMISPWHTNMVQNLGQDIFENSQRFARFGDQQTGIMGSGINFGSATNLARQVTALSYHDPRMNAGDYSETVSVGLKMSQFDHVRSSDEFVKKTKELASAVGDLTRTLHLSVKEISESMGAMRQYGIVDVADQRRTLMRIGAAAQVGGMSTGQAMEAWSSGAQMGHGLGITAQVAGQVGVSNAALARELSRSGVVPSYAVALGGGTEGIAKSITEAGLNFIASEAGWRQFKGGDYSAGGGRRDALADRMAGVYAMAKDPASIMDQQFRKMGELAALKEDPDKIMRVLKADLDYRLTTILGKDFDPTSQTTRNAAYMQASGYGMTDAARMAFVNANYTQRGLLAQESVGVKTAIAADIQQAKLDNDLSMARNSPAGQLNIGMRKLYSLPGQFSDAIADTWRGNGLTGWTDATSPGYQNLRNQALGGTVNMARPEDLLRSTKTFEPESDVFDFEGGGAWRAAGQTTGAVLGSKFGMGGSLLFAWAGSKLGMEVDVPSVSLNGADAVNYQRGLKAFRSSGDVSAGARISAIGKLKGNASFRSILDRGNIGNLRGLEAANFAKEVKKISDQTGVGEAEVYATASSHGVFVNLEGGTKGVGMSDEARIREFNAEIHGRLLSGINGVELPDFSRADNASLLLRAIADDPRQYSGRSTNETPEYTKAHLGRLEAEGELVRLMGGNEAARKAMDQIKENTRIPFSDKTKAYALSIVHGEEFDANFLLENSKSNMVKFRSLLGSQVDVGVQKERNQIFKSTMDVARGIIDRNPSNADAARLFKQYGSTNDFVGMLRDPNKDLEDLLSSQSPLYKTAYKFKSMSMDQLLSMSPAQMAAMGVGADQYRALKEQNSELGTYGPHRDYTMNEETTLKINAALMAAQSLRGTREIEQSKRDSDDALFSEAAQVLKELKTALKGGK